MGRQDIYIYTNKWPNHTNQSPNNWNFNISIFFIYCFCFHSLLCIQNENKWLVFLLLFIVKLSASIFTYKSSSEPKWALPLQSRKCPPVWWCLQTWASRHSVGMWWLYAGHPPMCTARHEGPGTEIQRYSQVDEHARLLETTNILSSMTKLVSCILNSRYVLFCIFLLCCLFFVQAILSCALSTTFFLWTKLYIARIFYFLIVL